MNISDLPFTPDVSPAAMKAALDFFTENEPFSGLGVANFRIIDQKGAFTDYMKSSCHGNIQYTGLSDRCLVATDNGRTGNKYFTGQMVEGFVFPPTFDELMKPFFDFLTKESWCSRFIINCEDREFMWDHGFILSADMPTPLMQNILIMTRHFREQTPEAFRMFNKIYELYPHHGMLAYLLSFGTTLSLLKYTPGDPIGPYNAHRAWACPSSLQSVENHLCGEFGDSLKDDKSLHYRVQPNYYGGAAYCLSGQNNGYLTFSAELLDTDKEYENDLNEYRNISISERAVPNPFVVKRSEYIPNTYIPFHKSHLTKEEIFAVLLPTLERKGIISAKTIESIPDSQPMDRQEAA